MSQERDKPQWFKPNAQNEPELKLFNSMTNSKEKFITVNSGKIGWYVCGPTVYDSAHIGHARNYVTFDIMRRVLEDYFGYRVFSVMNITDVEDKIIHRARSNYLLEQFIHSKPDRETAKSTLTEAWENHISSIQEKINQNQETIENLKVKSELSKMESQELKEAEGTVELHQKTLKYARPKMQEIINALENNDSSIEDLIKQSASVVGEFLDKKQGKEITDLDIFRKHASKYEEEFMEDMELLGVRPADVLTRVSEYIPEIVAFIQRIQENNYAYEANGSVYFDTQKFDQQRDHYYAKLKPSAMGDGKTHKFPERKSDNDFALWKKANPGEPRWDSPWGEGRPGWHIECYGEDTRILTNRGFLFIDQLEDAVKDDQPLLYACYDTNSAQIVYKEGEIVRPPGGIHKSIIEFTQKNEQQRWQDGSGVYGRGLDTAGSGQTDHLTIRVTKEHDVYAQIGSYAKSDDPNYPHSAQYTKHKASTLVGGANRPISMLACAENGVANTEQYSGDWGFRVALGLDEPSKFDAFLELYGFWLGDGSLSFNHGGNKGGMNAIVLNEVNTSDLEWLIATLSAAGLRRDIDWYITEHHIDGSRLVSIVQKNWVEYFFSEYDKKYAGSSDVESNPEDDDDDLCVTAGDKSAKWFWRWVFHRLNKQELRLIIRGLHRAQGDKDKRIYTSSVSFREELMIVLLHAGYTTFFEHQRAVDTPDQYTELLDEQQVNHPPVKATVDGWAVRWTDPTSTPGKEASWPSLNSAEVKEVAYTGRTWCVTVNHPDHLVFVQRAERDDHGVVTKAGRPIIMGQCSAMASELLGDNLDIHCGGEDLKFPHHDNELAQSEAYYGCQQWVNYFLHSGHLNVEGLKMSKSLKNFITIRQALMHYSPRQLRLHFLFTPWGNVMNYQKVGMETAVDKEETFKQFFAFVENVLRAQGHGTDISQKWGKAEMELHDYLIYTQDKVHEYLCDNINTPDVMNALLSLVSKANAYGKGNSDRKALLLRKIAVYITRMLRIFGVITQPVEIGFGDSHGANGAEGGLSGQSKVDVITPYIDAFAQFRSDIRDAAKKGKSGKEMLGLTDQVRDDVMLPLGVEFEDAGDFLWKSGDPQQLIEKRERKRAEEKQKLIKKKTKALEAKDRDLEKWEKAALSPQEVLKDKFSHFDEEGMPTHDKEGKELTGKGIKKAKKVYEGHMQKHRKYKEQIEKNPSFLKELKNERDELANELNEMKK
eukprot:gb/GECH01014680.1/.p1 GENE.gb/GECH01014680.1/~~gb/GECH01014680.1/.p1  ORF type:complete len:1220 (+),score=272.25 gb/GECH01014680.1/:1-3660(+)